MLERLGKSCSQFFKWKRCKNLRVSQNATRLMECTDEILAPVRIDPCLPPDRPVDHGQESRRDMDDRNSPHVGRRNEASQIPYYPSAKGNYGSVSSKAPGDELIGDPAPRSPRLARRSRRYDEYLRWVHTQRFSSLLSVERRNV